MAKKKQQNSDDFFQSIAELTNGEILANVDSIKYYVDTGNLALNYICSGKFIDGGIPGGKITEAYGPESSGKSLYATCVLRGAQRIEGIPAVLDCENANNKEFMVKIGKINANKVLRYTPETLERAFNKIYNVIKQVRDKLNLDVPIIVVYDSISVSPCEREYREVDLPDNYTAADWKKIVGSKEQPGERAKICSREFRKLNSVLEKNNATLLVINQIRSKVGVMFGSPEETAGGGKALKFYASCRFKSTPRKQIKHKIHKNAIGINFRVQNKKNKTHMPFVETEGIKLYFDRGIDPVSGLLSILLESGRIIPSGKGRYLINPDFTSDPEYKFSANKEDNSVPMQVLIDNPKLINAKDSQEVIDYLSVFEVPNPDEIEEIDVKSSLEDELEGYDSNDINEDELG